MNFGSLSAIELGDAARELITEWNRRGVIALVVYTDGDSIPVVCQRESDVKPLLGRVLDALKDDEPRTLQ